MKLKQTLTEIPPLKELRKIRLKIINYLISQSKTLRSANNFSQADKLLKVLRLLFPHRHDVLAESANLYCQMHNYETAIHYAKKVTGSNLNGEQAPGLLNRITTQATRHAIEAWDPALALKLCASIPNQDDRHLLQAEIYHYLGDTGKAQGNLAQVASAQKLSPANNSITKAILSTDEYQNLKSDFINNTGNIDSSVITYISLIFENEEDSKALQLIELHSRGAPDKTLNALAQLKAHHLFSKGRYEGASQTLEKLAQKSSVNASITNLHILSLLNQNKRPEAIALFESRPSLKRRRAFTPLDFYISFCKGNAHKAYDLYKNSKLTWALEEVFGDRYFNNINSISNNTGPAFIFIDGGVGDEIRHSRIYKTLERTGAKIHLACDPRLETLFTRTYPGLTFFPIKRVLQTKARLGLYANRDKVRKSILLAYICDNRAWDLAITLPKAGLLSALISSAIPEDKDFTEIEHTHLKPDPSLTEKYRQLLAPMQKNLLVGLSWRSTHLSTSRSTHYTAVAEWQKLFKLPGIKIINLQPKITDSEIDALKKLGAELIHLPDLDLFDDFESMAAVMSLLDIIIAPCNATLELAGAVGTPSFFTSPTFQTALRKRADGKDIWHPNVEIITPVNFGDKKNMIDQVCNKLHNLRKPG